VALKNLVDNVKGRVWTKISHLGVGIWVLHWHYLSYWVRWNLR